MQAPGTLTARRFHTAEAQLPISLLVRPACQPPRSQRYRPFLSMLSRPRQPAAPPPVSLVARPAGNHQQSPPGSIATKSLLLSSKSSLSLSQQDRQSKSDELGYLRLEYQGCMAFSPSCHRERESSTGKTTSSSQGCRRHLPGKCSNRS
ncbi:unnamed protein product [Linum trigynum]|uniref:Uncharacterized protein n=1 Tax=Linum trigynum TaxID=586398 RepID=A0AAV2EW40_9ROSI